METIQKICLWTAFHIVALVMLPRTSLSNGIKSKNPPEMSTWNDNFDQVLKLFNNQNIQTFHYNYFVSVTKGPTELTKYCMDTGKNIQFDNKHGKTHVYCVRSMPDLKRIVQIDLTNEGLRTTRHTAAWNAGSIVFQKYNFAIICVKHCNDGMKPKKSIGSYIEPQTRTSFSVGCTNAYQSCLPSCSDAIYDVRNGLVNCSRDTLVNSVCQLRCKPGYVSVGAARTQCNKDQSWDKTRSFNCLPADVGYVVNSLMKSKRLTLDKAMAELRNKIDKYLGEKSRILPTTRQESTVNKESMAAEDELIESVRAYLASLNDSPLTTVITVKRLDTCSVKPENRKDCGKPGISMEDCEAKGCCWNDTEYNTIWCFYKDNIVSPLNYTTKRTLKKPQTEDRNIVRPTNEVDPINQQLEEVELVLPKSDRQTLYDAPAFKPSREQKPEEKSCGCAHPQVTISCHYTLLSPPQPRTRIYCGKSIDINQSPWQAIVAYGDKMCGGTLISKDFVLTAAHCLVMKIGVSDLNNADKVYLGVTSRDHVADKSIQVHGIQRIIRHQQFKMRGSSNVRNDIALIKLAKPAKYTDSVRPLCLPGKKRTPYGKKCYISGFGEKVPQSGKAANTLQTVPVLIKKPQSCKMYQSFYQKENICAGSGPTLGPADACRGDSGGPLACQSNEGDRCSWYLAGITSFGKEPCGGGSPGVYVDVANFHEWISWYTGL